MKKTILPFFILIGLLAIFLNNSVSLAQNAYQQPVSSTPYCYQFKHYLVKGSTDMSTQGEVSILQNILYNINLLSVAPTGYFGDLTEAAVMQYQASRNIQPTGTVGPVTRSSFSNCNTTVPPAQSQNTIPITFYSFNKSSVVQVPLNSVISLPNLSPWPEYPNYYFAGWYADYNFTNIYSPTKVEKTFALFAKWVKTCNDGSSVVYPNDCNVNYNPNPNPNPDPNFSNACPSNKEFVANQVNCTCVSGFTKITYGDPASPTAICLPIVENCPSDKYFYSWDFPGCKCPTGFIKNSGLPGIDVNINFCSPNTN